MAWILPDNARSVARCKYSKAALPNIGTTRPLRRTRGSILCKSRTSMTPWLNLALFTLFISSTLISVVIVLRASRMVAASPITRGLHSWCTSGKERAMAMISGPIPAASPMVMPTIGLPEITLEKLLQPLLNSYSQFVLGDKLFSFFYPIKN